MRQQYSTLHKISVTLAVALLSGVCIRPAQAQYTLIDLGTSGLSSQAGGINASGQVIGYALNSSYSYHAVIWQNGGMQDLGTLGGSYSFGLGINDNGQAVGNAETADFFSHAFVWSSSAGMQDLGTLGGAYSEALSINSTGWIAGFSATPDGFAHAVLWDPSNGLEDLGSLPGYPYSYAYGINNAGQVAGYASTADGITHAFVWQNGTMQDLGDLGGGISVAFGINNAGQVVGYSATPDGFTHAFVWSSGTGMQNIGDLGGGISAANGINDAGQVVGYALTADGFAHAFVWQNGTMQDVGVLVGGVYSQAVGINSSGQIAGYADDGMGDIHAFVTGSSPTTQASLSGPSGSNGWYTGPVTVTLTATEGGSSANIASTSYSIDGGATQTYSGPFTVSGDAIHSLSFWSKDKFGATESPKSLSIPIDGTPPSVTAAANPATLSPPNGKMVPVTVSGNIADALSGVDPSKASFSVKDDYGQIQPSGSITVQSNGSYAFTVQLQALRNGNDKNGRHYTITVYAADKAGNTAAATTIVTVPHNK